MAYETKSVPVDGLTTRYIDGSGSAAIVLHGAARLKEKYRLNLHVAAHRKHLVQWDAMDQLHKLAGESLSK